MRRGRLHLKNEPRRGETYQQLLTRNTRTHLEASGSFAPPEQDRSSLYAYGAVFAEVAVDRRLGLVRVRRMLGVYDAGRIINPKLADSQALGGMVDGIGTALLEQTITDHRNGVATDYGPGVGWPEDRNTSHWLENRGTIPAVEISVDIVRHG